MWKYIYGNNHICHHKSYNNSLVPRLSLFLLPPFVFERKTLVEAGHVTTYDTGIESTNNFVDLNWSERKAIASHRYIESYTDNYTFEILQYKIHQYYSKLHIGQTKYTYTRNSYHYSYPRC